MDLLGLPGLSTEQKFEMLGALLACAGLKFMIRALLKRIPAKHDEFRYRRSCSFLMSQAWIMKNLVYLAVYPFSVVNGTSTIGRLTSLMLFTNCVLAYTFYPRHCLPRQCLHIQALFSQTCRNTMLAFIMGYYHGYYLTDSEFTIVHKTRIVIGIFLFFYGAWIKMNCDLKYTGFESVDACDTLNGGIFSYVAAPDQFAVLIQWIGFHMVAGNNVSMGFLLYKGQIATGKAFVRRNYYIANNPQWPRHRTAIIPFIC